MATPREVILYLDYIYKGDNSKIKSHINSEVPLNIKEFRTVIAEINAQDFITIADKEYPKALEARPLPPYVIPKEWAELINIRKEYSYVN